MFRRRTARAIIIKDGKILMFERWKRSITGKKKHYFSIPGGGIERGESPEAAVVRELKEEMTIDVTPLRLLSVQTSPTRVNHYYLCEIVRGTPIFNPESEEARYNSSERNRYEVAWADIDDMAGRVKHLEYKQFFERLKELLASTEPIDMRLEER